MPILAKPLALTPVLDYIYGGIGSAQISQLASTFTFGGTSLLIMVGVALEFFKELEAQLTMRSYKGFLS